MKIVLIHPPHINATDDRLDPPLGLLYLAASIFLNIRYDVEIKIVDLSGKKEISINDIPYADFYGITVYVTSLQLTKEIVNLCKKINPKCKTIVGGAHPTARPYDFPYVDHVVTGYGEKTIVDIILGKRRNHINIGIEPEYLFIMPSYNLVDLKSYSRRINNDYSIPYLTSRGCPYHCAYCGLNTIHKNLGYKTKFAPVKDILIQLKFIKEFFKINNINFQDDIFTLNRKRLKQILKGVYKLNLKFRCMGRAGYDNEDTYKMLSDYGCEQVSWGIESGSQYILDRMNKQINVSDNYNVINWSKKYNINNRAFFIIGFPGETKETLEETKKFIINSDPDQYFVSTFVPYPGTDVHDNPDKYGIINISNNYDNFYQVSKDGTGGMTTDTKWLSKEEFRELELDFRNWIKENKPMRGLLQEYEKRN